MIVNLTRTHTSNEGTLGLLTLAGDYLHTIELPWRDNAPIRWCIPAGGYDVERRISAKYGKCYEVTGVDGRSFVLFHHGNVAGDRFKGYKTNSAGCLLLGSRRGRLYGQQAVLASIPATRKFERVMAFEPFRLEITDA